MESTQSTEPVLQKKHVGFIGKLGGMNRREASRLVRQHGGIPVDDPKNAEIVVIGADELPLDDDSHLDASIREAASRGAVELINETDLWDRLGLVDSEQNIRRLYTPAMLAQLLSVPVSVIRRWHRRGLIVPTREVHRLPYFNFQEVSTARRLADLIAAGASPAEIEKKLEKLGRLLPGVERPLAQLSVIVEGRQILLRQGEGLVEPGGQMRLDFEAEPVSEDENDSEEAGPEQVIQIHEAFANDPAQLTTEDMVNSANQLEDSGQYEEAIEMYRAALMSGGIDAGICFRLAELLYISGDKHAARERYSVAIELDEDFVEARANLGCLLAELGDLELSVAAFRGAIKYHPDYPDVHYHLARILDDLNESDEAEDHWRQFLTLSPDSPWADEARMRLDFEAIEEPSV